MRTFLKYYFLLTVIFFFNGNAPKKTKAQGISVSFQIFYDNLSPHGVWVNDAAYGYIWIPNAGAGFFPYATNGYWLYTNYGWTWVSYYPWGWAPFHYGRWYLDPFYGYVWIPGNEWGPGWVTWRYSAGYYGWAPIGPDVSLSFAYSSGYNVPYNQWRFVSSRDMGRKNISNYYVNKSRNSVILPKSNPINNSRTDAANNVTYNPGPAVAEVEKSSRKKINPVPVKESDTPGQQLSKEQLQLYKPTVENNSMFEKKPVPSKVVDKKDLKTIPEKTTEKKIPENNKTNVQPKQTRQVPVENTPDQTQPSKRISQEKQPQDVKPSEKREVTKPENNIPKNKQQPKRIQTDRPIKNIEPEKQIPQTQPSQNNKNEKQERNNPAVKQQGSPRQVPIQAVPQQNPSQQKTKPNQNIPFEKQQQNVPPVKQTPPQRPPAQAIPKQNSQQQHQQQARSKPKKE